MTEKQASRTPALTAGRVNPLWLRSPWTLFRYPGLFAALAGGTLLLALASAAYPLFLSASQGALLRAGVDDPIVTAFGAGISYSRTNVRLEAQGPGGRPLYEEMEDAFDRLVEGGAWLAPAIPYIFGSEVAVTEPGGSEPESGPVSGRLVFAGDALEHVDAIEGQDGPGVWLPDLIADAVGAGPGDRIRLEHAGRTLLVPVDGVYRSLYAQPREGYWQRWADDVYLDPSCLDCPAPAQPILVDRDQALRWTSTLGPRRADLGWIAPLRDLDGLTLDLARDQAASAGLALDRAADRGDPVGAALACCGREWSQPCCYGVTEALFVSSLRQVITVVDIRTSALETAGRLLQGAGVVVAFVVVAAAGAFAHAARRTEAALLYARGVRWISVAGRSSLEASIPCVVGGAAGLALAVFLVSVLGPDGPTSPSAVSVSVVGTAIAVVAALVFLGAVAAVAYLRRSEHHRGWLRTLGRVPWELAIAAVAIYLYTRILDDGAFGEGRLTAEGAEPSLLLLIFPIVFVAGFGMLAGRLFAIATAWLRSRDREGSPSSYLAVRRLAGGQGPIRVLIAGSALCIGIFVQSQVMVGSLRATVDAKAKVYVGSDVQGRVNLSTPVPDRMSLPFTSVSRMLDAGDLPGGAGFDMLVIEPSTFASAAYWRDGFADRSLNDLLVDLSGSAADPLRAIVVRGPGIRDGAKLDLQQRSLELRVVGRADAFPGMTSRRPLIVVDRAALAAAFAGAGNPLNSTNATHELWVSGDPARATRVLAGLEYPPYLILTAAEVRQIPAITTAIEMFLVLNALGLAAALLVIAGMVMYLQARQRSQVVSYGLSLRMGMTDGAYRRSLAWELGTMLGVSFVLGAGLALIAGALVIPTIDPLPTIPPGPLLAAPFVVMTVSVMVLGAVVWVGAWLTEARAKRTDLGQVMRLAG